MRWCFDCRRCDDEDASSTTVATDGDCDGVLTAADCDDTDASLTAIATDADCDGVVSSDDCDDNDASSTILANDGDCDGVLALDDCDDADPNLLAIADDPDCDGMINLDLGGGQSMELVMIPAGADPQGNYSLTEKFYLMTTEVTQGMFTALMSYDSTENSTNNDVGDDYPAYSVNWHMAADFANTVTRRHNSVNGTVLKECYTCSNSDSISVSCTEAVNPYQCSGYILPTEAEWEYAARSGTEYDFWTPDGGGNYSAISCGNEVDDTTVTIEDGSSNPPALSEYAWFCGNRYDPTYDNGSKPVGLKLPNGFGLYDMHGNVREWIADWYECVSHRVSTDPYCGFVSSNRVFQAWWKLAAREAGGRHTVTATTLRFSGYDVGFRLGLHP